MVTGPQNNTNGEHDRWIPSDEWRTIVANVPLVSVDLVIEHDGGVLLGKRVNEPAKGEWFVPGGTVFKNERRTDAVHHVAEAELDEPVIIDECLGTYEHFYENSRCRRYRLKALSCDRLSVSLRTGRSEIVGDDQHSDFKVLRPPFENLHPYVERYLDDR